MALDCYFKISSKQPDHNGPLSEIISSQAIKEANKIVKQSTQNGSINTLSQQAQAAAKYAVENGNQGAIRRYSKEYGDMFSYHCFYLNAHRRHLDCYTR